MTISKPDWSQEERDYDCIFVCPYVMRWDWRLPCGWMEQGSYSFFIVRTFCIWAASWLSHFVPPHTLNVLESITITVNKSFLQSTRDLVACIFCTTLHSCHYVSSQSKTTISAWSSTKRTFAIVLCNYTFHILCLTTVYSLHFWAYICAVGYLESYGTLNLKAKHWI